MAELHIQIQDVCSWFWVDEVLNRNRISLRCHIVRGRTKESWDESAYPQKHPEKIKLIAPPGRLFFFASNGSLEMPRAKSAMKILRYIRRDGITGRKEKAGKTP
ncbi:PREDICTED: uncharacterized protein LOC108748226 [Trachymyrmex septentrionalis]|uniref:uncharacterized protein LOC108748226 n=1 Tax=Trachymyrmex septentrionalis TaxID=34720 RepID=UPI00084F52C7|nr:PREDICTED: uncharacterized protein LOC108748226 [Trachymyrmex septentrionalis]